MSQVVVAGGHTYRTRRGDEWRTQALVLVPLLDEWARRAPAVVTAAALSPGVSAHVSGGTLVLTGLPGRALPTLATADQHLPVRLDRPGRASEIITVTVPTGAALPFSTPPLALASAMIAVTGRVTQAAFPHAGIPGARLVFGGGATGALVALSVPVGLAHAAGSTVRERTLASGATTTVTAAAESGAPALELASTAALAAGTLLQVGEEIVVVDAVLGPGLVSLRAPLRRTAWAGTAADVLTLGAVGAATTLRRPAEPGDGVLLTAGPLGDTFVEVVAGPRTEYRRANLSADAAGSWRLAGVRGVPDLAITTSAAGFLTDGPRLHPLAPLDPTVLNTALRT